MSCPTEAAAVHEVEDARLSPWRVTIPRTLTAPNRVVRGAVYTAEGELLRDSQRVGGVSGDAAISADESRWTARPQQRLQGSWLYAGNWMDHFGHFIVETLPQLWVRTEGPFGLLAHPFIFGRGPAKAWQSAMLRLAGWPQVPVVTSNQTVAVEHLVVPERALVINAWAKPQARAVWRRIATAARAESDTPGPARVFLSRTAFLKTQENADARRTVGDPEAIDATFAERGFTVVAPETLSMEEQLRLVADAEIIAGPSGSAMHLAAFTLAPAHVLEIGDLRNRGVALPAQRVVDAACGHVTATVPFSGGAPEWDPIRFTDAVDELLGTVGPRPAPRESTFDDVVVVSRGTPRGGLEPAVAAPAAPTAQVGGTVTTAGPRVAPGGLVRSVRRRLAGR